MLIKVLYYLFYSWMANGTELKRENNFYILKIDQSPEIHGIYWANEQKCRKVTDLLIKYIFFNQMTFAAALLYAFYNISTGNMDTSTWFLPFSMDVPFSTESFVGWLILWFIQFNMSLAYITCMVTITTYFICCCFYIETICDHFDSMIQRKEDKLQYNEHLNEAVKLHMDLYE